MVNILVVESNFRLWSSFIGFESASEIETVCEPVNGGGKTESSWVSGLKLSDWSSLVGLLSASSRVIEPAG